MKKGSGRGSGQTFCRQSRVGSTFQRVGSGLRKVTRGQLWNDTILLGRVKDELQELQLATGN